MEVTTHELNIPTFFNQSFTRIVDPKNVIVEALSVRQCTSAIISPPPGETPGFTRRMAILLPHNLRGIWTS